eukprot:TRINITY_DN1436_c0_g1::TRINITY_DN1436_c0_g1_i1::g.27295::m.27295 TRINITY_DN1436_c0_g1::TRINITY_DN1436_c0_g1_i1::g.27295  ORF type:complete len:433 (+),score=124.82 TRINITY_DN1436_c0_g1_i1:52-1350(+)
MALRRALPIIPRTFTRSFATPAAASFAEKEEGLTWARFPSKGVDPALNWSLAANGVTPVNSVTRNPEKPKTPVTFESTQPVHQYVIKGKSFVPAEGINPIEPANIQRLERAVAKHLSNSQNVFVIDGQIAAAGSPVNVRVVTSDKTMSDFFSGLVNASNVSPSVYRPAGTLESLQKSREALEKARRARAIKKNGGNELPAPEADVEAEFLNLLEDDTRQAMRELLSGGPSAFTAMTDLQKKTLLDWATITSVNSAYAFALSKAARAGDVEGVKDLIAAFGSASAPEKATEVQKDADRFALEYAQTVTSKTINQDVRWPVLCSSIAQQFEALLLKDAQANLTKLHQFAAPLVKDPSSMEKIVASSKATSQVQSVVEYDVTVLAAPEWSPEGGVERYGLAGLPSIAVDNERGLVLVAGKPSAQQLQTMVQQLLA